jgi:hypothetical protein
MMELPKRHATSLYGQPARIQVILDLRRADRIVIFGKHIYRLRTPITAIDPVDSWIPSRPRTGLLIAVCRSTLSGGPVGPLGEGRTAYPAPPGVVSSPSFKLTLVAGAWAQCPLASRLCLTAAGPSGCRAPGARGRRASCAWRWRSFAAGPGPRRHVRKDARACARAECGMPRARALTRLTCTYVAAS